VEQSVIRSSGGAGYLPACVVPKCVSVNLQAAPDGLLIHTAGFDHDAGVFRIFDVWETREQGERFINERLNPIIEPMAAEAAEKGDETFTPPTRETWYDLHDSMTG
jgi:hypothetical protein